MTNNHDPLSNLWQRQEVVQADLGQVSKRWRKLRLKQRCYLGLDLLSLVVPFVIVWLKFDSLDNYTLALVYAVLTIGVVAVIYVTWLRRFALGWSNDTTDQHIKNLQKQIQNNIQIANLSLHSVWFVALLLIFFYSALYYFGIYQNAVFWDKVLFTLGINAVALPGVWLWASKRKKRFEIELLSLQDFLQGSEAK